MEEEPTKKQPKSVQRETRTPEVRKMFGEVLQHQRKARKLTRQVVALEAEIEPNHVYRIESGKVSPTIETFLAIARAMGVPAWSIIKELEELLQAEAMEEGAPQAQPPQAEPQAAPAKRGSRKAGS